MIFYASICLSDQWRQIAPTLIAASQMAMVCSSGWDNWGRQLPFKQLREWVSYTLYQARNMLNNPSFLYLGKFSGLSLQSCRNEIVARPSNPFISLRPCHLLVYMYYATFMQWAILLKDGMAGTSDGRRDTFSSTQMPPGTVYLGEGIFIQLKLHACWSLIKTTSSL